VAAFVGALSGFGFSLLIVPPLALVVGPRDAVILANILGPVQNLAMAIYLRRLIDWSMVLRLFVGAVVGMPVGLLVLTTVSASTMRLVARGVIGGLARRFHRAPTNYSHAKTIEEDAPEILRRFARTRPTRRCSPRCDRCATRP
jgi:uncharacterized membrane protein YfcA